jgi:hypothetical protein
MVGSHFTGDSSGFPKQLRPHSPDTPFAHAIKTAKNIKNGKEEQSELEVVEYEPGRKYAVRNVTQGITTIYTYSLRPADGGTQISLDCEFAVHLRRGCR